MKFLVPTAPMLVLVSLLAGCATSGVKYAELSPQALEFSPDSGRLYFYRTSALGAAVQPEVKLDGEVVGTAVAEGYFYVDRAPGTYQISTSTEVERTLTVTVEKGQTLYVRLNMSFGFFLGHVTPVLVDEETAKKEIRDCHYIGK
jgi:hypothetical protein